MKKKFRIYLDACCLNRPFDDQTQDRIKIEAEAVIIIFKYIRLGVIQLQGSEVLNFEINKTPDLIRRNGLLTLLKLAHEITAVNEVNKSRAKELENSGYSPLDAFHISCAEYSKADAFLTTDDKIISLFKKNRIKINIGIDNPINWIQEYIL